MPPVATTTRSTSSRACARLRRASASRRSERPRPARARAAASLLVERRLVRAGRQGDDAERVRMRREDVDGLAPDRAGRAEERDARGRPQARTATTYSVTTGAANRNESTRSSIPPWPGMSVAGVLGAGGALEHRLGQVAGLGGEGRRAARAASAWTGGWPSPPEHQADHDGRRDDAADQPGVRLRRRDVGQEPLAPEALADEVRARCRRPTPRGSAAGSSRAPRRGPPAARRPGRPGRAWPRRTTNASRLTYSAPNTVAIQVARPSRGSGRVNAATATSTIPTALSSSPLPSRTSGNAASRMTASARAVPSSGSVG